MAKESEQENIDQQMVVPTDKTIRNKIRTYAKHLVVKQHLEPPIERALLEQTALKLIDKLELSTSHQAYAMVMIGNEVWRPIYEATPYHRRLLLLPQCIRNKQHCTAKFDDFGLLCNACHSCHIDPLLQEAERLGYASLVAEGTTMALTLATEGSIDAVLGVSCMPILERSFTKVSKIALPAFGVPLLSEGCQETKIDIESLTEELRAHHPSPRHEPVSLSRIKHQCNALFKMDRMSQVIASNDSIDTIARDYLCLGGGRMRPLLTMLSYWTYAEEKDETIGEQLAILIECFHKASLIHDDIEDDASERYNQQTLHLRYNVSTAINVGDYLIGKGYQILASLDLPAEIKCKGLEILANSHVRLTQGQSKDLDYSNDPTKYGVNEVLEMFRLKTGEAIKSAIVLGAAAGHANEKALEVLSEFADALGIAYQIKDDLDEFRNDQSNGKIENYPILTALLMEQSKGNYISSNIDQYRQEIERFNILEHAQERLHNAINSANNEISKLEHISMRMSLHNLMSQIFA